MWTFKWGHTLNSGASILMLGLMILLPVGAAGESSIGSTIANTASISYELGDAVANQVSNTDTFTVVSPPQIAGDDSQTTIYRYDHEGSKSVFVQSDGYLNSFNAFVPQNNPDGLSVTYSTVNVSEAQTLRVGEIIIIEILDQDLNLDMQRVDTAEVRFSSSNGDVEVIRFIEAGANTGVFVGFISIEGEPATPYDGIINASQNTQLTISYESARGTQMIGNLLVDPFGIIFDSATGQPINGVTVTVIDDSTGSPAQVFGNDGISAFPSTVISGGEVTDAGGEFYDFSDGFYQFPLVAPGTYRLEFTLPDGSKYTFPSSRDNNDLQELPGAPYTLIQGSRGEPFDVILDIVRIDVPLDPSPTSLVLTKDVNKTRAALGDHIRYTLTVTNTRTLGDNPFLMINDTLPEGFKYRNGSTRINGTKTNDPELSSDGRVIAFDLGALAPLETINISYVALIATANNGDAVSTAVASSINQSSNNATVVVDVYDELMRDEGIIVGRVNHINDDGTQADKGIAGVKVYMETGKFVVTDENGLFHISGVKPGTHVLQIDKLSYPSTLKAVLKENTTAFAGNPYSSFVEVYPASLKNIQFYLQGSRSFIRQHPARPEKAVAIRPRTPSEKKKPSIVSTASRNSRIKKVTDSKTEKLGYSIPYDAKWLDGQPVGFEVVEPVIDAHPALPVIRVAIKHSPVEKIKVELNGKPIDPLYYDGRIRNKRKTNALSMWSGVHIIDGDNTLKITRLRKNKVISSVTRNIYYATPPVRVEYIKEESVLTADGINNPVIKVRFLDKNGQPAREGLIGTLSISKPYKVTNRGSKTGLIARGITNEKAHYSIGKNGIAHIKLEPTTVSGDLSLTFALSKGDVTVEPVLTASRDSWIVVGLAQGTLAHEGISANLEHTNETDDSRFSGRVALFIKGKIKGNWLLTAAYDSAKDTKRARQQIGGSIDPNKYYTVYGDKSATHNETPSQSKLYVRLEREDAQFLYGDLNINWAVSELSPYRRNVNGLQATYRGEAWKVSAFANRSTQSLQRQQFNGNGLTGPFIINANEIVTFSETVSIETRSRHRFDEVIATTVLARDADYSINYLNGDIILRDPIFSRNSEGDPQFLVVTYETENANDAGTSYGVRAETTIGDNVKIGATHIRETGLQTSTQTGIDARIAPAKGYIIRSEVSVTDSDTNGVKAHAYLASVEKTEGEIQGKLYYKKTEDGFGLNQTSDSNNGVTSVGLKTEYKISTVTQLLAEWYKDKASNGDEREVIEARINTSLTTETAGYIGLRNAKENIASTAKDGDHTTAIAGIKSSFLDGDLTAQADVEFGISGEPLSGDFTNRQALTFDYKVSDKWSVYAQQEWTQSEQADRSRFTIGSKSSLWEGLESKTTLSRYFDESNAVVMSSGLNQRWEVSDNLKLNFGLERSQLITGDTVASASGSAFATAPVEDFTALSVSADYKRDGWDYGGRVEARTGDTSDDVNLFASAKKDHGGGSSTSYTLAVLQRDHITEGDKLNIDVAAALVYNPHNSPWKALNKTDWIVESTDGSGVSDKTIKLVNNFTAVYHRPNDYQISGHLGLKYSKETLDGDTYSGLTYLAGAEAIKHINSDWDIGIHGNVLRSHRARRNKYAYGISVGYTPAKNTNIRAGYNFEGFDDDDFPGARYTRNGYFIQFSLKFDERSTKSAIKLFGQEIN